MKDNTKPRRKRSNGAAANLLRSDRGAMARIARRLGVHRSVVSKVARGLKTSERVHLAVIRECIRIAGIHQGAAAVL
jgi:hypothetical protein